jgi:hypothetical protein
MTIHLPTWTLSMRSSSNGGGCDRLGMVVLVSRFPLTTEQTSVQRHPFESTLSGGVPVAPNKRLCLKITTGGWLFPRDSSTAAHPTSKKRGRHDREARRRRRLRTTTDDRGDAREAPAARGHGGGGAVGPRGRHRARQGAHPRQQRTFSRGKHAARTFSRLKRVY